MEILNKNFFEFIERVSFFEKIPFFCSPKVLIICVLSRKMLSWYQKIFYNVLYMEENQYNLAENVLQILYPLRGEWEDAEWMIDAIQRGLLIGDDLIELANLLVRATQSVERDERIVGLSRASELVRINREKELQERLEEQKQSQYLISFL